MPNPTTGTVRPAIPISVERWIKSHARKHYWRVAGWYELDDLIQDGLVCACKCLERYGTPTPKRPGRINRPRLNELDEPHYMALVQTAFYRHIGDLVRSKRRGPDGTTSKFADVMPEYSESYALDRLLTPSTGDQELAVLLSEIPDRLRQLITKHLNGGIGGLVHDRNLEIELRAFLWENAVLA
jgi:hypothetical protein